MPLAPFALSILKRQHLLLRDGFGAKHPHDWLIWEAGPWRPAVSTLARDNEATRQPSSAGPARPVGEDCLCFALDPVLQTIHVGRGSSNEIVINDLTEPREHVRLTREGELWVVSPADEETHLNDTRLTGPTVLRSGARLVAGAVTLTYLSAAGLLERLSESVS